MKVVALLVLFLTVGCGSVFDIEKRSKRDDSKDLTQNWCDIPGKMCFRAKGDFGIVASECREKGGSIQYICRGETINQCENDDFYLKIYDKDLAAESCQ